MEGLGPGLVEGEVFWEGDLGFEGVFNRRWMGWMGWMGLGGFFIFPVEVGGVELGDFGFDFLRGEVALPEEDLGDGAVFEVAGEIGGGGADLEEVGGVVFCSEFFGGGDFFAIEVEVDFSVAGGGEGCEVLFAVVDLGAALEFADPADVVVELPVAKEEGFALGLPFSGGGGAGGEGAIFCGGLEADHEGEGLVHGEVFAGEGLEIGWGARDGGVGDGDDLGAGVAAGAEVDGCGVIMAVLEGEIGADVFTGGERDGVVTEVDGG